MVRCRFLLIGTFSTAAAMLLTGCFLFGPRTDHVSILGGKVSGIEVSLVGAQDGVCPGEEYQLSIRVTTDKGETFMTWSAPKDGQPIDKTGYADFSDFEYKLQGGTLGEGGLFKTDPDALVAAGTGYRIAAAVKDDTAKNATASYDQKLGCTSEIVFAGAKGSDGYEGSPGVEPGGEGLPHGGQGGDGGFGGNGGEVEVTSALVRTLVHRAAVLVKVQPKDGTARHFLIDPASEDGFTIDCRGGDGGAGGKGGDGSIGGNGGNGGGGGDGGDGGVIKGYFDTSQPLLQSFMKYLYQGGKAGAPGAGGAAGERDDEGRPMLPGQIGDPGQPGADGPWPDVRPEAGTNLFASLPEGVFVLTDPWSPVGPGGDDPNAFPPDPQAPAPVPPPQAVPR